MEYLDESKIEALRNILREDTNKPNRNTKKFKKKETLCANGLAKKLPTGFDQYKLLKTVA